MSTEHLGLIELTLVFGGVLVFGIYELWSLRRARRKAEKEFADRH